MWRIFFLLLPLFLFAQTPAPMSWDSLLQRLNELPELKSEQAGLAELAAERARLKSSFSPQVNFNVEGSGTTNPVAVFSGKLGNQSFGMPDFAIPTASGGFDTYPVNHPDPFWDGVASVQIGMRLWDGGERKGMDAHLVGLNEAQEHRLSYTRKEALLQYLTRRIQLDTLNQRVAHADEQVSAAEKLVELISALVEEGQVAQLNLSMAKSGLAHANAVIAGLSAQREAVRSGLAIWLRLEPNAVDGLPMPPKLTVSQALSGTSSRTSAEAAVAAFADAQSLKNKTIAPVYQPLIEGFTDWRTHQFGADNWTVGIKASWKLWDGHERRAHQAKFEAETAKARAEQTRVESEFDQARAGVSAYLKVVETRLNALERAVESAKSAWENHKALLEEGQMDQSGVFETRREWLEFEQQLLEARGEAQVLCWRALDLRALPLTQWLNKE